MAERWLRGIVTNRWARYAAAFGGVLVGATSWSVWNQSTVNEKVYTVSLFSIALVMWLVVRWGDDAPGPHRDRWLVLIAYVLALTSTNHLMGLLAVPALVVYVLWTDWRVLTRPPVLIGVVGVLTGFRGAPLVMTAMLAIMIYLQTIPLGMSRRLAPVPRRAIEITDSNAAFFDAANGFRGCIAGIHEVLRRQGLLAGRWCLNPREDLSPGQMDEIDRVYRELSESGV